MNAFDQVNYIQARIQKMREAKKHVTENIRKLEEYGEECNKQIEILLEMKFNAIRKAELEELEKNIKNL